MMEYEFTDPQGNRFCFRRGFGPKVYHPENLCSGTPYSAELILNRFDDQVIDSGFDHFYFDVLSRLPNYSPQRRITMARALADNHLILEKLKSLTEVVPDNRSILRVQIRNALRSIVEDEKREAAMHQRQMDKESTLMKGLIYTGAFMTGIGSSAWGLAVQAKEISDVINPFVKMQHHATALRAAWESDDFADTYTETYLSGEKRELVEAIGFDPSQITQQQIDEAVAMADLVLNDDSLRDILYGFVKDYAEAQHAIEITRVAGSGAFELILTIIVAAVTGGAGVVAAVGSKMHLLRKFKGVGEHLVEFAKASRSIRKAKKESQGQNTGPGKFESETGSAKQTNPHGAETGEVSKPKSATAPRTIKETHGTNTATWTVDENGRPISVEAKLDSTYSGTRSSAERKAQSSAGGAARLADDDGGHIVGHRFMSDQGEKNLFPQNSNLNRGAYKSMENEWADWTGAGYEVKLKVKLDPPGTDRPDNVIARYQVTDPSTGKTVFKRRHTFNNSSGEGFKRISKSKMSTYK
ncbi:MAG: hypothetical protein CSH37_10120 [Thalassolituus sp.]|nr:MAG: hypothetical protein CSH37_10120 [Thalassolituus sp.]